MTRILAVGDPHACPVSYGRTVEDWEQTADATLALALREHVDLIVNPGDLFDTAAPLDAYRIAVVNFFRRCETAGIPVIACNGNHDIRGPLQKGPVDELREASGKPLWGITQPTIVVVKGLQVAVLPFAKPAALLQDSQGAGDLAARTSAALVAIVRGLAAQLDPNLPAILIGHWPVAGCQTSSGMILSGGEAALPLGELQSLPFRATLMGHIHKPQVFPGSPLVLHTGCMVRQNFGEEHDPRGCYIVDTETGKQTWHEVPTNRFYTVSRELRDVDDIERLYADLKSPEIAEAIARVEYRAGEEIARLVDHQRIQAAMESAQPRHFAGIFPKIQRIDRTRAVGLTETASPEDGMEAWLALPVNAGMSEADKADVRRYFQMVRREVA